MVQMVVAFTSEQAAGNLLMLGLMGLLMLPIVASLGGLMWFLDRQLTQGLTTANQLLRECAPRAMHLDLVEKAGRNGLLIALNNTKSQPVHLLINPGFRWSTPPPGKVAVSLYSRTLSAGQPSVALSEEGVALIGKLVDRVAYKRQRQRIQWLVAVLVLAIVAALLTFVFSSESSL